MLKTIEKALFKFFEFIFFIALGFACFYCTVITYDTLTAVENMVFSQVPTETCYSTGFKRIHYDTPQPYPCKQIMRNAGFSVLEK